ncbi:helicase-related protein [Limnoraphis robusta]|uniref:helicase-related protein n=1 Tax=Limnoraphis robusta TaxID=1118279 RepID=UPI002B21E396|nr:helicase-related protein [Limnoraphis robusta]MEA5499225.1 helicase-related protein [Limnoraphis robusta BA-68 BA1]
MIKSTLGQELGRLFEVGFNIGMLAYIEQNQLSHKFGELYQQDLPQLSFPKMIRRLADKEQVISEQNRQIIGKWSTFFLQKGFLAGLNLFSEYIKSTGWSKHQLKRLEILYYQCCFSDDNSLGTYTKGEEKSFKEVLAQFGDIEVDIAKFSKKGEFLNADTIMLIRCSKQFRVLCIDYSIFSIKSIQDLVDVDNVEVLRKLLLSEISYLKSKSVFSNLGIDTKNAELNLSKNLKGYFKAFKREDKETAKLIQAGSYSYSFFQFLQSQGLLTEETPVIFNVVGYSDRGISAMSLNRDNLDILETCSQIYKHEPKDEEIKDARKNVLRQIQRNAAKSFENGRDFLNKFSKVAKDGITSILHQERIKDFCNSIDIIPPDLAKQLQVTPDLDLRNAHAELITKALSSDATYIFLTGNPGIGKTTAIANFLKSKNCLDEGFLFFYVSPRKQVNLDIIEKFKNQQTNLLDDDRIFTLTTSANLIKNNDGKFTVNYLSNERTDDFIEQTIHFINQTNELTSTSLSKNLGRLTEDQIQDIGPHNKGVLYSICQAIYTAIKCDLSQNIVATVSIQSLKKTQSGKDTLDHFEKIFKDAYNSTEGIVVPAEMKKISSKIKNLFIMIDEITGDDSGVEFLNGMSRLLKKYEVIDSQHGFNTKIIVADASIVDPDVIKQHLEETSAEPNKIFFRKVTSKNLPLSVQSFQFNGLDATVINANSYPAKSLEIKYKIFIESIKFNENLYRIKKYDLEKRVQEEIVEDIKTFLNKPNSAQVIVYIQDKQRLADLIEKIREQQGEFKQYEDYLEIHASLSEYEKKQIPLKQNQVKVIFMTASASRGLSFPKAKHILVDIPRFEIEKNLMEVIQVIYRGRGYYEEDGIQKTLDSQDKELVFYLSEQIVYYPKNPQSSLQNSSDEQELSLQETRLNLLNIILILKTSIMTRIFGSGNIGGSYFMMIPIGGKSVFAAGQTFSSKMSMLIKQLKKEQRKRPNDELLKEVYSSLEGLLNSVDINIGNGLAFKEDQGLSYLELRESFSTKFSDLINTTLDSLLGFTPIQSGYINGSLLVVPLAGRTVEEKYKMRIGQDIVTFNNGKLLHQMLEIKNSPAYPESIRSALNEAIELVNLLEEQPNKTQKFEQNSLYFDQYYALPLFTFITGEAMSQYFSSNDEEPEDQRFRDLLATYISSLYPVSNILPIGHKYKDFPWLVFRSYSLNEMRSKLFTDKYFLTSNELNILNLILAHQD